MRHMKMAIAEGLANSYSYLKYREILHTLLSQGKSSGPKQSEELLAYSQLNEARMDRLDKKNVVSEENINRLLAFKEEYIWLVLAEGWCGDAAQLVPIFNKLASLSPNIELKIAFRDDNEGLMNAFLTNGSRSIPKLIVLDKNTLEVRANWGPRPKPAAHIISSYKAQYGTIDHTAHRELHLWYIQDRGLTTQGELLDLMSDVENSLYLKR